MQQHAQQEAMSMSDVLGDNVVQLRPELSKTLGYQEEGAELDKSIPEVSLMSLPMGAAHGDCSLHPNMAEALAQLKHYNVRFSQPSPHQIKVGKFNFYPSSGKITVDGVGKVAEKGLDVFLQALRKYGMIKT